MKLRTFDLITAFVCILAILFILFNPLSWLLKCIFVFLILGLVGYAYRSFLMQHIDLQGERLVLTEQNKQHYLKVLPDSRATSHLCFLHLASYESKKCWKVPVGRLELSKEKFRRLKAQLLSF